MNRRKFYMLLSALSLLFSACGPKVIKKVDRQLLPLDYSIKVKVFDMNSVEIKDAELIGQIEIKDTGLTTKCTYSETVNRAKLEALKMGGNAIQIKELIRPDFFSSCFRLKANILQIK